MRIDVPQGLTPNYTSDEELRVTFRPGILRAIGALRPDQQAYIARDLAKFRRAESGQRERPDLDPHRQVTQAERDRNPAWKHGLPSPFAETEQHRPDRTDKRNSETRDYLRGVANQIEAEGVAHVLGERMGTDADRLLEAPTLRDQIAAATKLIDPGLAGD